MNLYLDTSAAMKLLVEEAESPALAGALEALDPADRLLSSWLLRAELHGAAGRHPTVIRSDAVDAVLDRVILVDLVRADLLQAPVIGTGLRSQDALHLAAAIRAGAEAVITYDDEQAAASRAAGMLVVRPG